MAKGRRHELKGKGKGKSNFNNFGGPRARSKTRADKPKLVVDPAQEEKLLAAQLARSGLYAAQIAGDGNCLFRALSDQLHGTPSCHLQLRHEICEFLADNPERYRLFVDEDVGGGFHGHVASMRLPGTYGTNIELSAFAHRYCRSIKVFQPGLVYVIRSEREATSGDLGRGGRDDAQEGGRLDKLTPREQRSRARAAKERDGAGKGKTTHKQNADREMTEENADPLYIIYHSWEHYSSVRNLSGPHAGLPSIREIRSSSPGIAHAFPPADDDLEDGPSELPPTPTTASSISDSTPIKRGRGRPRKNPPPSSPSVALSMRSTSISPPPDPSPRPSHCSLAPGLVDRKDRAPSASISFPDNPHLVRSRKQSPATSIASSSVASTSASDPFSSVEGLNADTDDEEFGRGGGEDATAHERMNNLKPKKRSPTGREKKEMARKRKVELRKAKMTLGGRRLRSASAPGVSDALLGEVRELFV